MIFRKVRFVLSAPSTVISDAISSESCKREIDLIRFAWPERFGDVAPSVPDIRSQQGKVEELAAINREVLDLTRLDNLALLGASRFRQ